MKRTGDICPRSGQWSVYVSGRRIAGRQVTMRKGKRFPPIRFLRGKPYYLLTDATRHKGKD